LEAFEPPLPIFEIASVPPRVFKLEAFKPPLPIFETMACTGKTCAVKRVCLQLTTSQKAAHHEKFVSLTNDINDTRAAYMDEVQGLAKKHGQYVYHKTIVIIVLIHYQVQALDMASVIPWWENCLLSAL